MKVLNIILKKSSSMFALMGMALLTACGSADTARDGIYTQRQTKESTSNNKYKNYFSQQGEQLAQVRQMMNPEEDEVFTDPDQYYSETSRPMNNEEYLYTENGYNTGYSSWGSNPTNININYYSSPYYYGSPFYSPYYYPYGFYSSWYWGPRYHYYPWSWGWGPYYSSWYFGFSYGFGFGGAGFYGYYHYGGYYPYGGYWGSSYYASRNYRSYHPGRRGYGIIDNYSTARSRSNLGLTNANTLNRREINSQLRSQSSGNSRRAVNTENRGTVNDNSRRGVNTQSRETVNSQRTEAGRSTVQNRRDVNANINRESDRTPATRTERPSQIRNPKNINAGGRRDVNAPANRGVQTPNRGVQTPNRGVQPPVNRGSSRNQSQNRTTPNRFYNSSQRNSAPSQRNTSPSQNRSSRSYNTPSSSRNYSAPTRTPNIRSSSGSTRGGSSGTRSGRR